MDNRVQMCSRCHKRIAVVFMTRIENGESKQEGLCLVCARQLGIKPVEDMLKRMGMSEEDIENIMETVLYDFPLQEIRINLPKWVEGLEMNHWIKNNIKKWGN